MKFSPLFTSSPQFFHLITAILVLIIVMWHAAFFVVGYRVTLDGSDFLLKFLNGPESIWMFAKGASFSQGRIGFFAVQPLNSVGSFLSGYLIWRVIFFAMYAAIAWLFGMWCSRLFGGDLTLPFFLVWLSMHPLAFEHMPPVAYPLQNTVPMLIVLLCRIVDPRCETSCWALASNRLILGIAMLLTEFATLFGMALIGAEFVGRYLRLKRDSGKVFNVQAAIRERGVVGDIGALLLAIVPYVLFRIAYPSRYDGNSFDGIQHLGRVAQTTFGHVIDGTVLPRIEARIFSDLPWIAWPLCLLAGAAMALALYLALPKLPRERYALVPVFAFLSIALILVTLPVTAAAKQQLWCVDYGSCGYLDSRISYLGVALAALLSVQTCLKCSSGEREYRSRLRGVSLLGGVLFAFTSFHNWHVAQQMSQVATVWERANLLSCFPEVQPEEPELLIRLIDPKDIVTYASGARGAEFWSTYLREADELWANCEELVFLQDLLRVRASPTLSPGQNARIAPDGSRFLGSGWSGIEDWGVWSDGNTAVLFVMPHNVGTSASVEVVLDFSPFFDERLLSQVIEIDVAGETRWSARAEASESSCCEAVVPLPPRSTVDERVRLDIKIARPHDGRTGTDSRNLGIALRSIALRNVE